LTGQGAFWAMTGSFIIFWLEEKLNGNVEEVASAPVR
jgi:hypothetical protein